VLIKKHSIGIDLGGTNIALGVVDSAGRILTKGFFATPLGDPVETAVAAMAVTAHQLLAEAGLGLDEVERVGVGSTGIANSETGILEYSSNLDWRDVPLARLLSAELDGLPTFIDNDANAAGLGEYHYGAARDFDTALVLTLGTGIGGAWIQNGQIYHGQNFAGMEVGHTVVERNGRPCNCGRKGCWEMYASATGLITTTRELMLSNPDSLLWELAAGNLENVGGRTAFTACRRGDATASEVIETYIHDLASGVTNLINIFQPEVVVLGGGLAREGETLLAPLRRICSDEVYSRHSTKNATIVAATLGNDAGIIGAALLGSPELPKLSKLPKPSKPSEHSFPQ
jgi:glucokinase